MKWLGWIGILLSSVFFTACSDDTENNGLNGGAGSLLVVPEVAAYGGGGQAIAGEDNITDISACLFEDGVLTQVFEHLQQTDGGYHVSLNAKKGTFYMLANTDGLIDLNGLKG